MRAGGRLELRERWQRRRGYAPRDLVQELQPDLGGLLDHWGPLDDTWYIVKGGRPCWSAVWSFASQALLFTFGHIQPAPVLSCCLPC